MKPAESHPTIGNRPLTVSEDLIRSIILLKETRNLVFGETLFSDPAWDILLELYLAKLAAQGMTCSELAISINKPATTTARWIAALEGRSLIHSTVASEQPGDPVLSLTSDGASKMDSLAAKWESAFVSI